MDSSSISSNFCDTKRDKFEVRNVGTTAADTLHHQWQSFIDTSPLANAMDKNKESLKVKLMLRRPINQLIAQGIIPSLKTPPAYHEQQRRLERAKTGDQLRAKIQQRPSRHELERRHIMPESSRALAASLVARQRMLKKAKIADQLNDQLSHRPGPLELIQKNILQTESGIEEAVKSGRLTFRATCEGQLQRRQQPSEPAANDNGVTTTVSGSTTSPLLLAVPIVQTAKQLVKPPIPILPNTELFQLQPQPVPKNRKKYKNITITSTIQSQPSPSASLTPAAAAATVSSTSNSQQVPKTRIIKFHEYKGPVTGSGNSDQKISAKADNESSYALLLEQQQLLLQYQLQMQQNYPNVVLPTATSAATTITTVAVPIACVPVPNANIRIENQQYSKPIAAVTTAPPPPPPPIVTSIVVDSKRLETMKVSDLRVQLKKRNLPVSGSKPQLVERLRPHFESADETLVTSSASNDSAVASSNGSLFESSTTDSLVREQQLKIEELKRELSKSQLQLERIRDQQKNRTSSTDNDRPQKPTVPTTAATLVFNNSGKLESFSSTIVPEKQPPPPPPMPIPPPPPLPSIAVCPTPKNPIKNEIDDILDILMHNGHMSPNSALANHTNTTSLSSSSSSLSSSLVTQWPNSNNNWQLSQPKQQQQPIATYHQKQQPIGTTDFNDFSFDSFEFDSLDMDVATPSSYSMDLDALTTPADAPAASAATASDWLDLLLPSQTTTAHDHETMMMDVGNDGVAGLFLDKQWDKFDFATI